MQPQSTPQKAKKGDEESEIEDAADDASPGGSAGKKPKFEPVVTANKAHRDFLALLERTRKACQSTADDANTVLNKARNSQDRDKLCNEIKVLDYRLSFLNMVLDGDVRSLQKSIRQAQGIPEEEDEQQGQPVRNAVEVASDSRCPEEMFKAGPSCGFQLLTTLDEIMAEGPLFLKAEKLQDLDHLWTQAQSRFLHVTELKSSVGVAKTDLTSAMNASSKKKQQGQDPENAKKRKQQEGSDKKPVKKKRAAEGAVYGMRVAMKEHHFMKAISVVKVV